MWKTYKQGLLKEQDEKLKLKTENEEKERLIMQADRERVVKMHEEMKQQQTMMSDM